MNRQQSPLIDGKILNFSDGVNNGTNAGSYDAKNDFNEQSYESFSFQEKLSIAQNDLLNIVPSINGSTHFGNGIDNMDHENLMIVDPNIILPEDSVLVQNIYLKNESISNTENQNEHTISLSNPILTPHISQSDFKLDINNIKGNNNNTFGSHPISIHSHLSQLSVNFLKPINHLEPIEEAKTNLYSRISSLNADNTFPNQKSKTNDEFVSIISSNNDKLFDISEQKVNGSLKKICMDQEDGIKVVYLKLKIDNYVDNKENENTELKENSYLKTEERDEPFMRALKTQKYEDDSKHLILKFYDILSDK